MNYAAISTDSNVAYAFLAPFAVRCLRQRGFTPLLILVGTPERWLDDRQLRLVLKRSREVGAVIHFVDIPNAKTATVAQCARLFAAGLPGLRDDDFILLGDIDMMVLGPWVGGNRDETKALSIWFSNAYSNGPCPHKTATPEKPWKFGDAGEGERCPHFPICYVGASAKTWREITGSLDPKQLGWRFEIEKMVSRVPDDPVLCWNWDETWLGERIRSWPGFEHQTQMIERHFVEGEWRLDRSDWHVHEPAWREANMKRGLEGVADAHLPRPGYTDEGWAKIRPLLEMALPKKLHAWMDDYREKFVGLT